MFYLRILFIFTFLLLVSAPLTAECSLDHFIIGVNPDGITGTDDDDKLFVDCRQKYRHSGATSWQNWYYPLSASMFSSYKYRIGEPGFDIFQSTNAGAAYTYAPEHAPVGTVNQQYQIRAVIVNISEGLRMVHNDYPQFTYYYAGEAIAHSEIQAQRGGDGHLHISYQAVSNTSIYWITWQLVDAKGKYRSSEPFTLVFNFALLAGDLVVDKVVNYADLEQMCKYWLADKGTKGNDYYERADTNRDGCVNMLDFSALAKNWLSSNP